MLCSARTFLFLILLFFIAACGTGEKKEVVQTSTGESAPVIKRIYGDGSEEGLFRNSLLITGSNFTQDMEISLTGRDEKAFYLGMEFKDETEVMVNLSREITQGKYLLLVQNESGSDSEKIEILKGEKGISCFDLNGNGFNEQLEDVNRDGKFDAADCMGLNGEKGDSGLNGKDGLQGQKGEKGETGEKGDPGINGKDGENNALRFVKKENLDILAFNGLFGRITDPATSELLLGIRKSSFGKLFLYAPSVFFFINGTTVPDFTATKLISFSQSGTRLYMHQSGEGRTIEETLPYDRILASFEIILEDNGAVAIDFNNGIGQLYEEYPYSVTDESCPDTFCAPYSEDVSILANIETGYIDDLKVSEEKVFLSQKFNFYPPYEPDLRLSALAYHNFILYRENPVYNPVYTNFNQQVGYFETPALIEKGFLPYPEYFIQKWDISKPIKFWISANTPSEVRDPIREGVLYWNRVFGSDILEVGELDVQEVYLTNPDYNVIQWVEWEAPSAYAAFQADPLTGEIFHGGIYLPNWLNLISGYLRTSYFEESSPIKEKFKRSPGIESDNFTIRRIRKGEFPGKGFIKNGGVNRINSKGAEATAGFLEQKKDFVRAIVAHEMGHVLGLRHNFAGNLGATVDPFTQEYAYHDYKENGTVSGDSIPTSTVMDYLITSDTIWTGRLLLESALPYDLAVIRWGYFGESLDTLDPPPYCADVNADAQINFDCWPFDSTNNPLLSANYSFFTEYSETLATALINEFIYLKAPPFKGINEKKVEEIQLSPDYFATSLLLPLSDALFGLIQGNRFLAVEQNYKTEVNTDSLNYLNAERIREDTEKFVLDTLTANGGIETLIYSFVNISPEAEPYPDLVAFVKQKFEALLDSGWFKSGETLAGGTYYFSEEEIVKIREISEIFFREVSNEYLFNAFQMISDSSADLDYWYSLDPYFSVADILNLEEVLLSNVPYIIEKDSEVEFGAAILGTETLVTVNNSFYKPEVKATALTSLDLAYTFLPDETWAGETKQATYDYLLEGFEVKKEEILAIINKMAESLDFPFIVDTTPEMNGPGVLDPSVVRLLPQDLQAWVNDQMNLLSSLSGEDIYFPEF